MQAVEFQDFGGGAFGRTLGGRAVLANIGSTSRPLDALIGEYDAVLDTGAGDSFTDIYGLKRLGVILYTQRVRGDLGS